MVKFMKKIFKRLLIGLTLTSFPINVWAYSSRVILGGQNVGIRLNMDGILVVGFYKINGEYNSSRLLVGDYITKVNNIVVKTIPELVEQINKNAKDNSVPINYIRNNKEYNTTLKLEKNNNNYKTGIYVKDNMLGNGTITYIDPESKTYGALGHYIIDSNTNEAVKINDGNIFKSIITSITKSINGNPGSINTNFVRKDIYGTIEKNTIAGIFGTYNSQFDHSKLIDIAKPEDVNPGKATIYTSLGNNEFKEYEINILRIEKNNKIKNFYFEINDKDLIAKTGGIVQGMSGSPIIQNNKLIGAVTHVSIDNVESGYGISIINMLEESEK